MVHEPQLATDGLPWMLVRAAAGGSAGALELLCERCRPLVERWLWFRWRHSPFVGLIEDATQEVFVECLRPDGALSHADPARSEHGFDAYLRGVVAHVAARVERRYARDFAHRRRLAVAAARADLPQHAVEAQMDRRWVRAVLARALARLETPQFATKMAHSAREFLALHLEQGLPVREIARRWHLHAAQVHELRRRAMRRLKNAVLHVLGKSHCRAAADEREAARELLALLD
ncbi:MAG: hypothetical protein RL398_1140 [Planctomycetota bacterium]